jgi:hypothetical protein
MFSHWIVTNITSARGNLHHNEVTPCSMLRLEKLKVAYLQLISKVPALCSLSCLQQSATSPVLTQKIPLNFLALLLLRLDVQSEQHNLVPST